jgi:hypothetical protein
MLRIGLTGGIASGKSTVAQLFAAHGATVIDTDAIAHEVVEPGTPGLAALVSALGSTILDEGGRLDRAELRRRVFADAATRREVEAILHPAIVAELERQSRQGARALPGVRDPAPRREPAGAHRRPNPRRGLPRGRAAAAPDGARRREPGVGAPDARRTGDRASGGWPRPTTSSTTAGRSRPCPPRSPYLTAGIATWRPRH